MWYENIAGRFFGLVRKHACDRRMDRITTPKTTLAELHRAVKTLIFGSFVRDSITCPWSSHTALLYFLRLQLTLYHHQFTHKFVAHPSPIWPHKQASHFLKTCSIGTEVAGVQKSFSNSTCKSANSALFLTLFHSVMVSSSRLLDSSSVYSIY